MTIEELIHPYLPYLPYVVGIIVLIILLIALTKWNRHRQEEENGMVSIPSGRSFTNDEPLEEETTEEVEDENEEEDEYPKIEVTIRRWKDKERTLTEHVTLLSSSNSGFEHSNGWLTFNFDQDGVVHIDSDHPDEDYEEEVDSNDNVIERAWNRVFFWYSKDTDSEPDTSDDTPEGSWEPSNIVKIKIEDGPYFTIEFDDYDELDSLTPDFYLESEGNGIIRITDDKSGEVLILDTDDARYCIGLSFIEKYRLN